MSPVVTIRKLQDHGLHPGVGNISLMSLDDLLYLSEAGFAVGGPEAMLIFKRATFSAHKNNVYRAVITGVQYLILTSMKKLGFCAPVAARFQFQLQ